MRRRIIVIRWHIRSKLKTSQEVRQISLLATRKSERTQARDFKLRTPTFTFVLEAGPRSVSTEGGLRSNVKEDVFSLKLSPAMKGTSISMHFSRLIQPTGVIILMQRAKRLRLLNKFPS
jgi:hypothetical protein